MDPKRSPGRPLGVPAVPMAITAEALRDLRERMIAASSPSFLTTIAKGGWRAEETDGVVEGTGGVLHIEDGVGVISVNGPLFKSTGGVDDWMRRFFGCTAYDDIWRAVEQCRERGLKGALLRFNSPGGDAGGVGELADFFYSLRGKFTLWSYIETQCASAAMWLASQTEKIVAHDTGLAGWIGVIRGPILDDSEFMEKHGFRMIEIVSKHAKAKRTVPLDDEVLARFQVMADDLGDRFEAAVARGRGVSPEEVAEKFGQGDGMIAEKALEAGLIDKLGSFNSMLEEFRAHLAAEPASTVSATKVAAPLAAEAPVIVSSTKKAARAQTLVAKVKGDRTMATKSEGNEENKSKAEDDSPDMVECDKCGGSGKNADGAECKHCEGDGEIEKAEDGDEGEGARAEDDHEEPDGDEQKGKAEDQDDGKKALAALSGLRASASIAAHAAAIEAKRVPRSKVTTLEARVATMEAERKAEKLAEENQRLNATADRAAARGYFAGLKPEEMKAKRERFIKIARNEPDAAEEIIASLPAARVAGRVTAQGNPTGGRHSTQPKIDATDASGGGRRINHGDVDVMEKGSSDLMARAKDHMKKNGGTLEDAMVAVARIEPSLMQ